MIWLQVFTNHGWRVFSEEMRKDYLPQISTGRSEVCETEHVKIEFPGPLSEPTTEVDIDGLSVQFVTDELTYVSSLLHNLPIVRIGDHDCVKLRGRMEGVLLMNQQRWTLLDKVHAVMREGK